MDTHSSKDQAYIARHLKKSQRFFRAAKSMFWALLSGLGAYGAFNNGNLLFCLIFSVIAAFMVWDAWGKWKECELKELATFQLKPTKTSLAIGYLGCSAFLIACVVFVFIAITEQRTDAWVWCGLACMLCAMWVIQFIVPTDLLTTAAMAEKARLDRAKSSPVPSFPDHVENKLGDIISGIGALVGGLVVVAIIIGLLVLLFSFAPWWAAVIILLLLILLIR